MEEEWNIIRHECSWWWGESKTWRKNGIAWTMMQYAIEECRNRNMTFARLHVDAKNIWLNEWYERLGFKELSRDENEIEMIKEL